jgi:hypothetical protein
VKTEVLFVDNLVDEKCDLCATAGRPGRDVGFMKGDGRQGAFTICTWCFHEMLATMLGVLIGWERADDIVASLLLVHCKQYNVSPDVFIRPDG